MILQPPHTAMPYVLLAELGIALFGGSAASAGERITLEAIGAVRMAGSGEIRTASRAPRRAEAVDARETAAERAEVGMAPHRN
jgi:hypothetical protein